VVVNSMLVAEPAVWLPGFNLYWCCQTTEYILDCIPYEELQTM